MRSVRLLVSCVPLLPPLLPTILQSLTCSPLRLQSGTFTLHGVIFSYIAINTATIGADLLSVGSAPGTSVMEAGTTQRLNEFFFIVRARGDEAALKADLEAPAEPRQWLP